MSSQVTPLPAAPALESPVLRYHGGKFRLSSWVQQHFPPHQIYVEPFGGAAGVLLTKPRSPAEVYNDLDGDVVNFFRVLRDPSQRRALVQACALTPYARAEFDAAWEESQDPVERARRLAIRALMGFGSAGATKGTTGFRIDTKRAGSTAQQIWAGYPETLSAAGRRLSGVLIENRPAIEVIAAHDGPETLHYVDPPYLHSTRSAAAAAQRYYRHEMTDQEHGQLLATLQEARGMVVLSGYASPLYDNQLAGWERREIAARASGNRGSILRKECVWLNPRALQAVRQRRLL